MSYLQFIIDHKKELVGSALAIHAALVHLYICVWHAGGYRTLWRNFQGPKSSPPEIKPDQPS